MRFIGNLITVISVLFLATTSFGADISESDVKIFLNDWLAAQNKGSYPDYAALYSESFVGIKRSGKSMRKFDHDSWLKDRKTMFKKKMLVAANSPEITISGTTALVKFEQTWESGTYKDKGYKVLDLSLEDEKLKIVREEMLFSIVDTKFSSAFTRFNKDCKNKFSDIEEGQDMPIICNGPYKYKIEINYSACCEYVQVSDNKNFVLDLPAQIISTVTNRVLEWRLANGKPFAVILKLDKYKGDLALDAKKVKEVLLIKGLKKFEDINYEVDIKGQSNPNLEARSLADQSYMRLLQK
ncbi:hypothetical protein GeomeDRAFT_2615 [Geobacter metallireducens RCH3]|nr:MULTISPECIES: nuclear transport factor 2 family protein [Geobacter]EHP85203.1 hypothetical protein GeomeDRAFT_2615 [Geobacter metallireducens RCH3]MBT1076838.1 nuclear transport factor 2 family protein [Geobacter grbiciae]